MGRQMIHNIADDHGLPDYLKHYDTLQQKLRAELKSIGKEEEDKFERFVSELIPETDVGSDFGPARVTRKSRDGGIDLVADGKDGHSILYVQAKRWVDETIEIDSVLSKFQDYLVKHHGVSQLKLFESDDDIAIHFILITLSPLQSLIKEYEQKYFGNRDFYFQKRNNRQLHF